MRGATSQVSLDVRTAPQVTVTPELRKSLELLELPAVELYSVLSRWVEENPFLEMEDCLAWPGEQRGPGTEVAEVADDAEGTTSDPFVRRPAPWPTSLYEYLHWQLGLEDLPDDLMVSARILIDALEPTGYLGEDLESIAARHGLPVDRLEEALPIVQRLDPPGVGARNARESLLLQLRALREEGGFANPLEGGEIAERLLADYSHLLDGGRSTLRQLATKLRVSIDRVAAALDLLRSLKPFPAAGLLPTTVPVVLPDFTVWRTGEGDLTISLNREIIPTVRCTEHYARHVLSRLTDPQQREVALRWLMEARRIERGVWRRNLTLERLGETLLEVQADFFRFGPQALRPLSLEDVAGRLGLHKSTVSRALRGKYVETPRGVFPLAALFSARVRAKAGGQDVSTRAVKERIRSLIATESPSTPLSDAAIQQVLSREGIHLSRRTIAKYRAELGIPPHYRRTGRSAYRDKE